MPTFRYTVAVTAESKEQANTVMDERLRPDENYGFAYQLDHRFERETTRTLADDERNQKGL